MSRFAVIAAAVAALSAPADESEKEGDSSVVDEVASRISLSASADVETAYICRGYVWDTRPFSVQDVSLGIDLGSFGIPEATVWTYSPMSSSGQSGSLSHYAYAEVDYLLRYYYDIDIAEGWRLRSGVGRQWVTNPGFHGGRTMTDWRALQVLHNPWLTPYWRLRVIRRPIDETYWVLGVKRSFDLLEGLTLTADFFGDLGDRRHFHNLFGDWVAASGCRMGSGLHSLNLVLRLDYRLFEHFGLFAFVGQFCVVDGDARDAVKAMHVPEAKRDLTYGGAGVSVSF